MELLPLFLLHNAENNCLAERANALSECAVVGRFLFLEKEENLCNHIVIVSSCAHDCLGIKETPLCYISSYLCNCSLNANMVAFIIPLDADQSNAVEYTIS